MTIVINQLHLQYAIGLTKKLQMSINDKIKEVLTLKNLSPSYLADDIGVQRSSISHILSGRNRPSLDIIQKIVRRFPEFSYEWFLEDDIQMSTESLADTPVQPSSRRTTQPSSVAAQPQQPTLIDRSPIRSRQDDDKKETIVPERMSPTTSPAVERILIFYANGTFREYKPAWNQFLRFIYLYLMQCQVRNQWE